jgi:hypothetical protein
MEMVGHQTVSDYVDMRQNMPSYLLQKENVFVGLWMENLLPVVPLVVDVIELVRCELHFFMEKSKNGIHRTHGKPLCLIVFSRGRRMKKLPTLAPVP